MKTCTTCRIEKDLSAFSKKGKGLQAQCKACRKLWFAEHYSKNKQYYIDRNKVTAAKTRQWYNEYKTTLSCQICGEDHPACLDFHHRDPREKEVSVGAAVRHSRAKLLREIAKCDVLCANCHRKHHATA